MRGAYGKPYGLSARVKINQVMFSIRTTLKGEDAACEALRKVLAPPYVCERERGGGGGGGVRKVYTPHPQHFNDDLCAWVCCIGAA